MGFKILLKLVGKKVIKQKCNICIIISFSLQIIKVYEEVIHFSFAFLTMLYT